MRPLLSKLRGFAALPVSDRHVLIEAMIVLPAVGLGLRWFHMNRLTGGMRRVADARVGKRAARDPHAEVLRTRRLLGAAARNGLYAGTCLSRSVTFWWLLRRRGVQSDLRIGVRKQNGKFEAHAWVEGDGIVLNDRIERVEDYAAFDQALTR
jgi:hypothetical protein